MATEEHTTTIDRLFKTITELEKPVSDQQQIIKHMKNNNYIKTGKLHNSKPASLANYTTLNPIL